jgi:FAD:protein FMN transferase
MFSTPDGMVRDEFRAMGTAIHLLLPIKQAREASQVVRQLFVTWEETFSRFLPTSELSQLNQRSGTAVLVSQLLFDVLQTALAAAQQTNGLYDPTLLQQLLSAGYDRSFDTLPAQQPERSGIVEPGGAWRDVQLDPILRLVTLPAGVGLDFGGIAKGMAVDAALASLKQLSLDTALVNAGGDLAVMGLPDGYSTWSIAIQGLKTSWLLPFHHGALATSSIARRHWQQGTIQRHHLLDPRTGEPARSSLWSVTVAASTCMQAEVATKAVYLLGLQQGKDFLTEHALAGFLLHKDGSWSTAGSWPAELMRPLEDTDE